MLSGEEVTWCGGDGEEVTWCGGGDGEGVGSGKPLAGAWSLSLSEFL